MAKKQNLCIYCKEPYKRGRGWESQSGKMWNEGETEEEHGVPYKLFWHSDCQAKHNLATEAVEFECNPPDYSEDENYLHVRGKLPPED